MENKPYRLRYLPLFQSDLTDIVDYITNVLLNPSAADELVNRIEEAILTRLETPLISPPFQSSTEREHPYRAILVGNYAVFYVVIGDVMEVRRVLYKGRDFPRHLQ